MHSFTLSSLATVLVAASAVDAATLPWSLSDYAPVSTSCPSGALVRPAVGLNSDEAAYKKARKPIADKALTAWLKKTSTGFVTDGITLPTIGLSVSGGSYRSLLSGAGVVQGFDARDSAVSTSGLLQAISYQTGLSGGGWLLSSLAGNNYPTVSYLRDNIWREAFGRGLLLPKDLIGDYGVLLAEIVAKKAQDFGITYTDPWGRLLAFQLLGGEHGGSAVTLSSLTELSNFTSYNVPYPIITSVGVKAFANECLPAADATTYEFSPYEFGSWDKDVAAFTPTKYLGTPLSNGVPTRSGLFKCIKQYDNLGYVLGTSSNLFSESLCDNTIAATNSANPVVNFLSGIVNKFHEVTNDDTFSDYPNPFYKYKSPASTFNAANDLASQSKLTLVDGGLAGQNNPVFPMLQPARGIDVLFVNDNSNNVNSYPNGTRIEASYQGALRAGLSRMPFIPSATEFVSKGLNKRATFFGCDDADKITIIYLPNTNITFASNLPTTQYSYTPAEVDGTIANGQQIASQGGDANWGSCVGCALMKKTNSKLPAACNACFDKYCYKA